MIRRFLGLLRWLLAAIFGLTIGAALGAIRPRPQSPAIDTVEAGPGDA